MYIFTFAACGGNIWIESKIYSMRKAAYYNFNRYKNTYYYFLGWESQRLLPIMFGRQCTLNLTAETN